MRMNGKVLRRLLATTQSHCGTCWVTGTLLRHSSYTSEQRADSRTSTVISRCFQLRLMFPLPPLPFSLPLTRRWRSCHQDIMTAPSPLTLCSRLPFPLLCPEAPHMHAIAASTTGHICWLCSRPDHLSPFFFWCMLRRQQAHIKSDPKFIGKDWLDLGYFSAWGWVCGGGLGDERCGDSTGAVGGHLVWSIVVTATSPCTPARREGPHVQTAT